MLQSTAQRDLAFEVFAFRGEGTWAFPFRLDNQLSAFETTERPT